MLICLLSLRQINAHYFFAPVIQVFVAEVQTPVVQVIQPQMNLPSSYPNQSVENNYIPPYPTNLTGI